MLDRGVPPEAVALYSRHSLRSSAFDAYLQAEAPLEPAPTRSLRLAAVQLGAQPGEPGPFGIHEKNPRRGTRAGVDRALYRTALG